MSLRRLSNGTILLGQHVDGLELAWEPPQHKRYGYERNDELEEQLADCQSRAMDSPALFLETKWRYGTELEPVLVWPQGIRGARYRLECLSWLFGINSDGKPGPRGFVQLRAPYLATVGALSSFQGVRSWADSNLLPLVGRKPDGLSTAWRVSRIDLAADVAGVSFEGGDVARFTTRARSRRAYHEPAITDYDRRRFTGFRFGKRGGAIFARIYRKTDEAKSDDWVREKWRLAGYDPTIHGPDVWRVEFEIRGALIRELQANGERLPREPDALLSAHLGTLWHYAMQKWLLLRDGQNVASRPERQAITPWWRDLGALAGFAEAPLPDAILRRVVAPSEDAVRLLNLAIGALTSLSSLTGKTSWPDTIRLLDDFVKHSYGRRRFEEISKAKQARRRALRGNDVLDLTKRDAVTRTRDFSK